MKKQLFAFIAIVTTLLFSNSPMSSFAVSLPQQQRYVIVDGANVRLRLGPSLESGWLHNNAGQPVYAPKGSRLLYLGQTTDFYKVKYSGKEVYISRQFSHIAEDDVSVTPPANNVSYVVINGTNVRLRLGPGTNYSYLTNSNGAPVYLPKGTSLKYLGQQGDFNKAEYKGRTVYISKKYSYISH